MNYSFKVCAFLLASLVSLLAFGVQAYVALHPAQYPQFQLTSLGSLFLLLEMTTCVYLCVRFLNRAEETLRDNRREAAFLAGITARIGARQIQTAAKAIAAEWTAETVPNYLPATITHLHETNAQASFADGSGHAVNYARLSSNVKVGDVVELDRNGSLAAEPTELEVDQYLDIYEQGAELFNAGFHPYVLVMSEEAGSCIMRPTTGGQLRIIHASWLASAPLVAGSYWLQSDNGDMSLSVEDAMETAMHKAEQAEDERLRGLYSNHPDDAHLKAKYAQEPLTDGSDQPGMQPTHSQQWLMHCMVMDLDPNVGYAKLTV